MGMDLALSIGTAASPWLFGFAREAALPHLILGLYLFLASLTAHRVPSRSHLAAPADEGHGRRQQSMRTY